MEDESVAGEVDSDGGGWMRNSSSSSSSSSSSPFTPSSSPSDDMRSAESKSEALLEKEGVTGDDGMFRAPSSSSSISASEGWTISQSTSIVLCRGEASVPSSARRPASHSRIRSTNASPFSHTLRRKQSKDSRSTADCCSVGSNGVGGGECDRLVRVAWVGRMENAAEEVANWKRGGDAKEKVVDTGELDWVMVVGGGITVGEVW